MLLGTHYVRKTSLQCCYHFFGVIHGQCRLGDESKLLRVTHFERSDVFWRLDQVHAWPLPHVLPESSLNLRVSGMTDEHTLSTILVIQAHFHMHFGDQWTGGIVDMNAACLRLRTHGSRYSVGTENHDSVIRHLIEFIDKDCSLG